MSGEKNINQLLKSISPKLFEEEYVFCSIPIEQVKEFDGVPICQFQEAEVMTLIITKQEAENAGIHYQFVSKMITLSVHSSLEAVGFLAAVTNKLAESGISVNAVSAYYHDRLFVPSKKADRVIDLLTEMSE